MFEKIKNYFVNFINTRNVTFYIAFGFAVLSLVFGITATATLSAAGATATAVGFTVAGFVLFVFFSLVGHEWLGAASSALAAGGALVAIVCECYSYFVDAVMALSMTGINMTAIMAIDGVSAAIACIVGLLICAIAENVFVYLRLKKKEPNFAPEVTAGQNNLTEDAQ